MDVDGTKSGIVSEEVQVDTESLHSLKKDVVDVTVSKSSENEDEAAEGDLEDDLKDIPSVVRGVVDRKSVV